MAGASERIVNETRQPAHSLGKAKRLPFGVILRRAIQVEFKTNKLFADRLGVSQGRVSQVMSGSEPVGAQTLEAVIACFDDLGHQEQLRESWLRTFSPSTLDLVLDDANVEADRLIRSLPTLIEAGHARSALAALEQLHLRTTDKEVWTRLIRANIDLLLFLGRSYQAAQLSKELVSRGKAEGELGWIATGLWTAATAGRNAVLGASEIVRLHEAAVEFIAAWSPSSATGKEIAWRVREAVIRDRALTLLAVHEQKPLGSDQLERINDSLSQHLERELRPDTRAVFLEVKGRVELAMEELCACEDTLEQIAEGGFVSSDFELKKGILQARLWLSRSKHEESMRLLEDLENHCFAVGAMHHASVIERATMKAT